MTRIAEETKTPGAVVQPTKDGARPPPGGGGGGSGGGGGAYGSNCRPDDSTRPEPKKKHDTKKNDDKGTGEGTVLAVAETEVEAQVPKGMNSPKLE